jgi:hypothetical protein
VQLSNKNAFKNVPTISKKYSTQPKRFSSNGIGAATRGWMPCGIMSAQVMDAFRDFRRIENTRKAEYYMPNLQENMFSLTKTTDTDNTAESY